MPMPAALARTTAALLLAGASCVSHATLITFDERPWLLGPDGNAFWSNPITGWYDSLGVDFGTAYLQPFGSHPDFSRSQYILGPNGYDISFTSAVLPTHVALNFSSPSFDFRSVVTALDATGQVVGSANTGGQYIEGGVWYSTPYHPRSFAAFHSDAGISRLVFTTAPGGQRLEAAFDNLYFGNVAAIPEPATMALWAAGLGVIGLARRRRASC